MSKITGFKRLLKLSRKFLIKPVVVSAGMPRSGSTLLFNILREILLTKWRDRLSCGWVGDVMELPKGAAFLIKMHKLSSYYRWRAQYVFYTYRDVRVPAVSGLRSFNRQITMESIRSDIEEYEVAKKASNLIIKYEELLETPNSFIRQLAQMLSIQVNAGEIYQNTLELSPPGTSSGYSKETLLHKKHFTHTSNNEWREIIPHELQVRINEEFSWWFRECGYPPK